MDELEIIATGLRFPEGPIALADGSVLVVEVAGGRLTRVRPDGSLSVVAELGFAPNGAAIGADGRCYVCNNGGFEWWERDGVLIPGVPPASYDGGWIEAVDIATGQHEVLYRDCDGRKLAGPNDIVFDEHGGFWFTDHGKTYRRSRDRGGVFYARPDGSAIEEVISPLEGPNGIGLSPDGKTLYVAETITARLWSFAIDGPGRIKKIRGAIPWERGHLVVGLGGYHLFDSLAVEETGNVCVATVPGEIVVVAPDGSVVRTVKSPDPFTTNICFGGPDLTTAYVTMSSHGKLARIQWPAPGTPLHFLNRR